MKFELKTEKDNDNKSKSFLILFKIIFSIAIIIPLFDAALKLGFISRYYQIENSCNILSVDKSASNFKKLSKLSNLKSKQRIWDFCREVIK